MIQGLKLGADSYSPELRSLVWIQTLDCYEFGLWLTLSIRDPNVAWRACRPRNCAKEIIYDSRLGGKKDMITLVVVSEGRIQTKNF